jgi:hypothetical protein
MINKGKVHADSKANFINNMLLMHLALLALCLCTAAQTGSSFIILFPPFLFRDRRVDCARQV